VRAHRRYRYSERAQRVSEITGAAIADMHLETRWPQRCWSSNQQSPTSHRSKLDRVPAVFFVAPQRIADATEIGSAGTPGMGAVAVINSGRRSHATARQGGLARFRATTGRFAPSTEPWLGEPPEHYRVGHRSPDCDEARLLSAGSAPLSRRVFCLRPVLHRFRRAPSAGRAPSAAIHSRMSRGPGRPQAVGAAPSGSGCRGEIG